MQHQGVTINEDGEYEMHWCPKCQKKNEEFMVGSGECFSCGYQATGLDVVEEDISEENNLFPGDDEDAGKLEF